MTFGIAISLTEVVVAFRIPFRTGKKKSTFARKLDFIKNNPNLPETSEVAMFPQSNKESCVLPIHVQHTRQDNYITLCGFF